MSKHPPYHLRINKAVDRLAFMDAIRILSRLFDLKNYKYYGMGGPYLDEFRILYDFCPDLKMVSLEREEATYKRQKFHIPCKNLSLVHSTTEEFLRTFEVGRKKAIFWLDYVDLSHKRIIEFQTLLSKLSKNSVIKISLRANFKDWIKEGKEAEFCDMFDAYLLPENRSIPANEEAFAMLIQKIIQVASQKSLDATDLVFQPISSFFYEDGAGMYTITGIIRNREEVTEIKDLFKGWQFNNLTWQSPNEINLPHLSTKERLFLQKHLPGKNIKQIEKILGYSVGKSQENNRKLLNNYATYHRYFPHFMKVSP